jgi:uncharacterized membrane protein YqjE
VFEALLRLIPALLRHIVAYGDLFVEESSAAARSVRRQLLGVAVLLTAGGVAALMACVWVIAATWEGPHRMQAIGALCIGFAVVALIGAWYAKRGVLPGQPRPFERLHAEWRQDLTQLATVYPSLNDMDQAGAPPAGPTVTPERLYVD